jgi:hypothetical protein
MDACSLSHIFELHHGLKVCCACPCRASDGWALSHPTLESKHTIYHRESYHGALKRWFSFETKGLRGCRIDWLVWKLTTTMA